MNPIIYASHADRSTRHYANLEASLAHRLAVAQQHQDQQLVTLLQREWDVLHRDRPSMVSLATRLRHGWQTMWQTMAQWSRLQVRTFTDQAGLQWWHAYDPRTGATVYTESESELRSWVETHYTGR